MGLVNLIVSDILDHVKSDLKSVYPDSYNVKFLELRLSGIEGTLYNLFSDLNCGGYEEFMLGLLADWLKELLAKLLSILAPLIEALTALLAALTCPQDDRNGGLVFNAQLNAIQSSSKALSDLPQSTFSTNWSPNTNYPFVSTSTDMQYNFTKTDRLEGYSESHHQSGNFTKQDSLGNYLHSLKGSLVQLINKNAHLAIAGEHSFDIGGDHRVSIGGEHSFSASGSSTISISGSASKSISGSSTVSASSHVFNGDVLINGNLKVTGSIS